MAVCSSSPAVGARCIHLRHGVGAVASQNITDPRLGERVLDLLGRGRSAQEAIDLLALNEPTIDYRQIGAVGSDGSSAVLSGRRVLGVFHQRSEENVAALGNLLATESVIDAMIESFLINGSGDLGDRLLGALATALRAGGEAGPVRSAALVVTNDAGWPETDLRVYYSDSPIHKLKRLWSIWAPQRHDYITRGVDPRNAPKYGVAGDM
jgi:uncharacterized Ntn-hydrolase superfamily protein